MEYLTKHELLNNTYILYTSDHGYHLGQWRIPCSKQQMYETDIRVPMFMRGPGIPSGSSSSAMVGNIDILPTFVDLANIVLPNASVIDGKSMVGSIIPEFRSNIVVGTEIINNEMMDNQEIDELDGNRNRNRKHMNPSNVELEKKQKEKQLGEMREQLRVSNESNWRSIFLSQYRGAITYEFSHCATWWIGNSTELENRISQSHSYFVNNKTDYYRLNKGLFDKYNIKPSKILKNDQDLISINININTTDEEIARINSEKDAAALIEIVKQVEKLSSVGKGEMNEYGETKIDTSGFPGVVLRPPPNNYFGIPWHIDGYQTNNWRMIRIWNTTHNWSYGEFINVSWTEYNMENPTYIEFYDLNDDFYQTKNLYVEYKHDASKQGLLQQLHTMLMTMGTCSGHSCFV